LGLGLSIASKIAKAHAGSLEVTSDQVRTRFTFGLPLNVSQKMMELMTQMNDEKWMRRAIELACEGQVVEGANPIGCVIIREGEVLAEGFNEVDLRCDATAHAEIVTMRRASEKLNASELRGATLYTTLQPCGMCSMASIWAKIGRIVYAAGRDDVHHMYFEARHLDTVDFIRDAFRDDLTLEGGVLAAECARLYIPPDADIPKDEQFNR
jgi:tRNA(adenine34) deaminase